MSPHVYLGQRPTHERRPRWVGGAGHDAGGIRAAWVSWPASCTRNGTARRSRSFAMFAAVSFLRALANSHAAP
eukprot:scaffold104606_cov55-Phaeocystis_antarctica.AAC.3